MVRFPMFGGRVKILALSFFLAFVVPTCFGQQPIACASYGGTEGCRLFNEMLAHHDDDIMRAVTASPHTLVCFKSIFKGVKHPESTDFFLVMYYPSLPSVIFSQFTDGQQSFTGTWLGAPQGGTVYANDGFDASVNDTEFMLKINYTNAEKNSVERVISIRRSTGRFSEQAAVTENGSDLHYQTSGLCAEYKKPAKRETGK
jgi:hypothetical protein